MSIRFLKLSLASPESIRSWTERVLPNGKRVGKILKGDLIDYKNGLPIRDGLSCERIFGPMVSFTCTCGRFKCIETRGIHIVHDTLRSSRPIVSDVSRQTREKQFDKLESPFQSPTNLTNLETGIGTDPIISQNTISKPIQKLVSNQKPIGFSSSSRLPFDDNQQKRDRVYENMNTHDSQVPSKKKVNEPRKSAILQPIAYNKKKIIRFLSDFYYDYKSIYHFNKNEMVPSFVSILEEPYYIMLTTKDSFKPQKALKKRQIAEPHRVTDFLSVMETVNDKNLELRKTHLTFKMGYREDTSFSRVQNLLKPLYKFVFQIYIGLWFDLKMHYNNFVYEKNIFLWTSQRKFNTSKAYDNFRVHLSFFSKLKIQSLYDKSQKLPIISGILPHPIEFPGGAFSNFSNLPRFLILFSSFAKIIRNSTLKKTNPFFFKITENHQVHNNWYNISILRDISSLEIFFKGVNKISIYWSQRNQKIKLPYIFQFYMQLKFRAALHAPVYCEGPVVKTETDQREGIRFPAESLKKYSQISALYFAQQIKINHKSIFLEIPPLNMLYQRNPYTYKVSSGKKMLISPSNLPSNSLDGVISPSHSWDGVKKDIINNIHQKLGLEINSFSDRTFKKNVSTKNIPNEISFLMQKPLQKRRFNNISRENILFGSIKVSRFDLKQNHSNSLKNILSRLKKKNRKSQYKVWTLFQNSAFYTDRNLSPLSHISFDYNQKQGNRVDSTQSEGRNQIENTDGLSVLSARAEPRNKKNAFPGGDKKLLKPISIFDSFKKQENIKKLRRKTISFTSNHEFGSTKAYSFSHLGRKKPILSLNSQSPQIEEMFSQNDKTNIIPSGLTSIHGEDTAKPYVGSNTKQNIRVYKFKNFPPEEIRYCPYCEVELLPNSIRRYRLGYIEFISPVTHIWYTASSIPLLLNLSKTMIEGIASCHEALSSGFPPVYKWSYNGESPTSWTFQMQPLKLPINSVPKITPINEILNYNRPAGGDQVKKSNSTEIMFGSNSTILPSESALLENYEQVDNKVWTPSFSTPAPSLQSESNFIIYEKRIKMAPPENINNAKINPKQETTSWPSVISKMPAERSNAVERLNEGPAKENSQLLYNNLNRFNPQINMASKDLAGSARAYRREKTSLNHRVAYIFHVPSILHDSVRADKETYKKKGLRRKTDQEILKKSPQLIKSGINFPYLSWKDISYNFKYLWIFEYPFEKYSPKNNWFVPVSHKPLTLLTNAFNKNTSLVENTNRLSAKQDSKTEKSFPNKKIDQREETNFTPYQKKYATQWININNQQIKRLSLMLTKKQIWPFLFNQYTTVFINLLTRKSPKDTQHPFFGLIEKPAWSFYPKKEEAPPENWLFSKKFSPFLKIELASSYQGLNTRSFGREKRPYVKQTPLFYTCQNTGATPFLKGDKSRVLLNTDTSIFTISNEIMREFSFFNQIPKKVDSHCDLDTATDYEKKREWLKLEGFFEDPSNQKLPDNSQVNLEMNNKTQASPENNPQAKPIEGPQEKDSLNQKYRKSNEVPHETNKAEEKNSESFDHLSLPLVLPFLGKNPDNIEFKSNYFNHENFHTDPLKFIIDLFTTQYIWDYTNLDGSTRADQRKETSLNHNQHSNKFLDQDPNLELFIDQQQYNDTWNNVSIGYNDLITSLSNIYNMPGLFYTTKTIKKKPLHDGLMKKCFSLKKGEWDLSLFLLRPCKGHHYEIDSWPSLNRFYINDDNWFSKAYPFIPVKSSNLPRGRLKDVLEPTEERTIVLNEFLNVTKSLNSKNNLQEWYRNQINAKLGSNHFNLTNSHENYERLRRKTCFRKLGRNAYYFKLEQMTRLENAFLKNLFYRNKFQKINFFKKAPSENFIFLVFPFISTSIFDSRNDTNKIILKSNQLKLSQFGKNFLFGFYLNVYNFNFFTPYLPRIKYPLFLLRNSFFSSTIKQHFSSFPAEPTPRGESRKIVACMEPYKLENRKKAPPGNSLWPLKSNHISSQTSPHQLYYNSPGEEDSFGEFNKFLKPFSQIKKGLLNIEEFYGGNLFYKIKKGEQEKRIRPKNNYQKKPAEILNLNHFNKRPRRDTLYKSIHTLKRYSKNTLQNNFISPSFNLLNNGQITRGLKNEQKPRQNVINSTIKVQWPYKKFSGGAYFKNLQKNWSPFLNELSRHPIYHPTSWMVNGMALKISQDIINLRIKYLLNSKRFNQDLFFINHEWLEENTDKQTPPRDRLEKGNQFLFRSPNFERKSKEQKYISVGVPISIIYDFTLSRYSRLIKNTPSLETKQIKNKNQWLQTFKILCIKKCLSRHPIPGITLSRHPTRWMALSRHTTRWMALKKWTKNQNFLNRSLTKNLDLKSSWLSDDIKSGMALQMTHTRGKNNKAILSRFLFYKSFSELEMRSSLPLVFLKNKDPAIFVKREKRQVFLNTNAKKFVSKKHEYSFKVGSAFKQIICQIPHQKFLLSRETKRVKKKLEPLALLSFNTTKIEFFGSLKIYAKRKFLEIWHYQDQNFINNMPLLFNRLRDFKLKRPRRKTEKVPNKKYVYAKLVNGIFPLIKINKEFFNTSRENNEQFSGGAFLKNQHILVYPKGHAYLRKDERLTSYVYQQVFAHDHKALKTSLRTKQIVDIGFEFRPLPAVGFKNNPPRNAFSIDDQFLNSTCKMLLNQLVGVDGQAFSVFVFMKSFNFLDASFNKFNDKRITYGFDRFLNSFKQWPYNIGFSLAKQQKQLKRARRDSNLNTNFVGTLEQELFPVCKQIVSLNFYQTKQKVIVLPWKKQFLSKNRILTRKKKKISHLIVKSLLLNNSHYFNSFRLTKLMIEPQIVENSKHVKHHKNMICYAYAIETIQKKKRILLNSTIPSKSIKNVKFALDSAYPSTSRETMEWNPKYLSSIHSLSIKISCFSYFGYSSIASLNLGNKLIIQKKSLQGWYQPKVIVQKIPKQIPLLKCFQQASFVWKNTNIENLIVKTLSVRGEPRIKNSERINYIQSNYSLNPRVVNSQTFWAGSYIQILKWGERGHIFDKLSSSFYKSNNSINHKVSNQFKNPKHNSTKNRINLRPQIRFKNGLFKTDQREETNNIAPTFNRAAPYAPRFEKLKQKDQTWKGNTNYYGCISQITSWGSDHGSWILFLKYIRANIYKGDQLLSSYFNKMTFQMMPRTGSIMLQQLLSQLVLIPKPLDQTNFISKDESVSKIDQNFETNRNKENYINIQKSINQIDQNLMIRNQFNQYFHYNSSFFSKFSKVALQVRDRVYNLKHMGNPEFENSEIASIKRSFGLSSQGWNSIYYDTFSIIDGFMFFQKNLQKTIQKELYYSFQAGPLIKKSVYLPKFNKRFKFKLSKPHKFFRNLRNTIDLKNHINDGFLIKNRLYKHKCLKTNATKRISNDIMGFQTYSQLFNKHVLSAYKIKKPIAHKRFKQIYQLYSSKPINNWYRLNNFFSYSQNTINQIKSHAWKPAYNEAGFSMNQLLEPIDINKPVQSTNKNFRTSQNTFDTSTNVVMLLNQLIPNQSSKSDSDPSMPYCIPSVSNDTRILKLIYSLIVSFQLQFLCTNRQTKPSNNWSPRGIPFQNNKELFNALSHSTVSNTSSKAINDYITYKISNTYYHIYSVSPRSTSAFLNSQKYKWWYSKSPFLDLLTKEHFMRNNTISLNKYHNSLLQNLVWLRSYLLKSKNISKLFRSKPWLLKKNHLSSILSDRERNNFAGKQNTTNGVFKPSSHHNDVENFYFSNQKIKIYNVLISPLEISKPWSSPSHRLFNFGFPTTSYDLVNLESSSDPLKSSQNSQKNFKSPLFNTNALPRISTRLNHKWLGWSYVRPINYFISDIKPYFSTISVPGEPHYFSFNESMNFTKNLHDSVYADQRQETHNLQKKSPQGQNNKYQNSLASQFSSSLPINLETYKGQVESETLFVKLKEIGNYNLLMNKKNTLFRTLILKMDNSLNPLSSEILRTNQNKIQLIKWLRRKTITNSIGTCGTMQKTKKAPPDDHFSFQAEPFEKKNLHGSLRTDHKEETSTIKWLRRKTNILSLSFKGSAPTKLRNTALEFFKTQLFLNFVNGSHLNWFNNLQTQYQIYPTQKLLLHGTSNIGEFNHNNSFYREAFSRGAVSKFLHIYEYRKNFLLKKIFKQRVYLTQYKREQPLIIHKSFLTKWKLVQKIYQKQSATRWIMPNMIRLFGFFNDSWGFEADLLLKRKINIFYDQEGNLNRKYEFKPFGPQIKHDSTYSNWKNFRPGLSFKPQFFHLRNSTIESFKNQIRFRLLTVPQIFDLQDQNNVLNRIRKNKIPINIFSPLVFSSSTKPFNKIITFPTLKAPEKQFFWGTRTIFDDKNYSLNRKNLYDPSFSAGPFNFKKSQLNEYFTPETFNNNSMTVLTPIYRETYLNPDRPLSSETLFREENLKVSSSYKALLQKAKILEDYPVSNPNSVDSKSICLRLLNGGLPHPIEWNLQNTVLGNKLQLFRPYGEFASGNKPKMRTYFDTNKNTEVDGINWEEPKNSNRQSYGSFSSLIWDGNQNRFKNIAASYVPIDNEHRLNGFSQIRKTKDVFSIRDQTKLSALQQIEGSPENKTMTNINDGTSFQAEPLFFNEKIQNDNKNGAAPHVPISEPKTKFFKNREIHLRDQNVAFRKKNTLTNLIANPSRVGFRNSTFNYGRNLRKLRLQYLRNFRRLRFIEYLKATYIKPEWMILSLLPVLPPDLRPVIANPRGYITGDINTHYQNVIYRNNNIEKLLDTFWIPRKFYSKIAFSNHQKATISRLSSIKSYFYCMSYLPMDKKRSIKLENCYSISELFSKLIRFPLTPSNSFGGELDGDITFLDENEIKKTATPSKGFISSPEIYSSMEQNNIFRPKANFRRGVKVLQNNVLKSTSNLFSKTKLTNDYFEILSKKFKIQNNNREILFLQAPSFFGKAKIVDFQSTILPIVVSFRNNDAALPENTRVYENINTTAFLFLINKKNATRRKKANQFPAELLVAAPFFDNKMKTFVQKSTVLNESKTRDPNPSNMNKHINRSFLASPVTGIGPYRDKIHSGDQKTRPFLQHVLNTDAQQIDWKLERLISPMFSKFTTSYFDFNLNPIHGLYSNNEPWLKNESELRNNPKKKFSAVAQFDTKNNWFDKFDKSAITQDFQKYKKPAYFDLDESKLYNIHYKPVLKLYHQRSFFGSNIGIATGYNQIVQALKLQLLQDNWTLNRNLRISIKDNPVPRLEKNIIRTQALHDSKPLQEMQYSLQKAVDALIDNSQKLQSNVLLRKGRPLKSLSDNLKGKEGRFRQHLLGKRVDYSGRSVIVVGPDLKLYECGIPLIMALRLFQPFLILYLIYRFKIASLLATQLIQRKHPMVINLLKKFIETWPILLNRAPTLHRMNIQAFKIRLVQGKAILLHPLVCSSYNADFDGDQMGVHVPITQQARAESWKLLWSINNSIGIASRQPLFLPSQDMVIGNYYLTAPPIDNSIAELDFPPRGEFSIDHQFLNPTRDHQPVNGKAFSTSLIPIKQEFLNVNIKDITPSQEWDGEITPSFKSSDLDQEFSYTNLNVSHPLIKSASFGRQWPKGFQKINHYFFSLEEAYQYYLNTVYRFHINTPVWFRFCTMFETSEREKAIEIAIDKYGNIIYTTKYYEKKLKRNRILGKNAFYFSNDLNSQITQPVSKPKSIKSLMFENSLQKIVANFNFSTSVFSKDLKKLKTFMFNSLSLYSKANKTQNFFSKDFPPVGLNDNKNEKKPYGESFTGVYKNPKINKAIISSSQIIFNKNLRPIVLNQIIRSTFGRIEFYYEAFHVSRS